MWNASRSFSPRVARLFNAWLDRIYDDFHVEGGRGRRLPKGTVLEIAKWRV